MKVKIAVFGIEEMIKRVHTLAKYDENIEVLPFTYTHSSETLELIERAFMCDVYLFTEATSYLYVRDKIKKKRLPAVQVAFDEYMILTSFYRLRNDYKQELDRISIDILNGQHVEAVRKELNFDTKQIYHYSYGEDESLDIQKITSFHRKLWDEGKIDYILTSSKEVEIQLKKAGIPGSCMIIPEINLLHAIQSAKSLTELNQHKSALLVAGYIRIKNQDQLGEQELEALTTKMQHILDRFAERTDSLLTDKNDYQFVIVGTGKLIDHLQNHYRDFPLTREFEAELNLPIDIGFGLGLSASEAEAHAHLALEKCKNENHSLCYIVNERKDTIGPIGIRRDIDTSRLFHALIHKARLNNELSYNFIDFITDRNNEPFSSNDIAAYYKVTKRSAERTVNKLLSGNVIKVSGEERPYLKGRPRKLFSLNN
ncbi:hypothetical protein [Oceanobacillus polygoni]|uniref:Transcriptional regulator n=1 Tax=Oceanobacillus polygoni TaxID=1235259 RepID=A0A9X1CEN8_9BACI|nr:hypothetical protein [Oceanobacillus polygoni]MBP2076318.1 hypothetical protein [Oceanobacillus polygoni]